MRKLIPLLLVSAFALSGSLFAADMMATKKAGPSGRTSPHETTSVVIGARGSDTRVGITYGRPYSKDPKSGELRKIWGKLVPYDKADRLGADEATLLLTQSALTIGGTTVPAGAYTLYIVPSENGATKLAFSSNLGKWGIPVDESKDVARFDLTKETLPQQVDQLTIAIEKNSTMDGGTIKIMWETTQFSLPFMLKK